jgi:succinyl-diaminopimelate desuccinylase
MLVGGSAAGGTNFNIVPDRFSFTIDRRPNPDEDYAAAKRELLSLLETVRERGIDLAWEVLQDAHSAATPADSTFVRTVVASVAEIAGGEPVPI